MSKKSKTKVTCLGCGGKMKTTDAACRRCGEQTPVGQARKSMLAGGVRFIGKAMRPRCAHCGKTSIPSARHCTSCGRGLLTVVKSAGEIERDRYMAMFRREPDPGLAQVYWKLANPDVSNGGRAS
jgi:predicted amidophosphoribosyltransferase